MLDISKIFSLFSNNEELDGSAVEITSFNDLLSTPIYWLGMFKKLISNCDNFTKKFLINMSNDAELDLEEMEEAYKLIAYNRAYNYVSNIDLNNEEHRDAIIKFNDDLLKETLNTCVLYFESYEEYEKCLLLKNISDFCKSLPQKT